MVGDGQNSAQRPAPLDLEGEGPFFLLEHVPHKRGGHKGAAQSGGGGGQELVDVPGPLHDIPAGNGGGLNQAVARDCSDNFVGHRSDFLSCGEKDARFF